MAKNYPEVWIGRVEKNLTSTDKATFLDKVSEIDAPIIVSNEGSASEKNIINIPTSDFEVDLLINNTAYPIAVQEYKDDTAIIALDKYQTKVTSISDDQAIGAAYDMIDSATKGHTVSILSGKYKKAIHSIAPAKQTALTPVIATTGDDDGIGRKMLTRKDIIALKKAFDKAEIPAEDRILVLCADHVADLLSNDQRFATQYYNYTSGKIADLYGFEVHEYIACPVYKQDGNKLAYGAVAGVDEYQASVAFYAPNIAKKTGLTKQYFAAASSDPTNQTNRLNYRHYFIATPKRNRYIGAIMSAKV